MAVIELTSGSMRARLDPERGGVIASLALDGVEWLYRPPWPPGAFDVAARSETDWMLAWKGGWNLLFPSVAGPTVVAGRQHTFHGDASVRPWRIVSVDGATAVTAFEDSSGLTVTRTTSLRRDGVVVSSSIANVGGEPQRFVLAEHLVLGEPFVASSVQVHLNAAPLVPLSDDGPPLVSPDRCAAWPVVDRGNGREDWSRRPAGPASRFGSIPRPKEGIVVDAPEAGLTLSLTWSESLPFAWIWEEAGAVQDPPWDSRVHCLAVEPTTSPTGEPLGSRAAREWAPTLEPGEIWSASVALRASQADRPLDAGVQST